MYVNRKSRKRFSLIYDLQDDKRYTNKRIRKDIDNKNQIKKR